MHIVGIEIGHHVQDVRFDMTSVGLTFFTLVAEDAKAFSQNFDPSITDIVVDPEGRVVFMADGADSLRKAFLFYRSHSAWQSAHQ